MQNQQQQNEDTFLCLSFSTYSSNNINDIAFQLTHENDNSLSQNDTTQNDNTDFEFFAFHNTANDEIDSLFEENFPIFNRENDGRRFSDAAERRYSDTAERRYSDAAEISISFRKLLIGDEKQSPDPLSSEEKIENDLNPIPAKTYCIWKPKSKSKSAISSPVASPAVAWPMKCKKSNSTGSSTNSSSKRWKFMSLLRRSKSDVKESLILGTPSKESENLRLAGKKIPATAKKIPATVPAIEAVYGRKKEMRRKSYLPYKQELIGFGVGFNAFGRAFPLHA